MRARVLDAGTYELFDLPSGHRLLRLNEHRWFVWILGARGDRLIRWTTSHARARLVAVGEFLMLSYTADPGVAHLFLDDGERLHEYLLAQGLPAGAGGRPIVATQEAPDRIDLVDDIRGGPRARAAPGCHFGRPPPESAATEAVDRRVVRRPISPAQR